MHVAWDNPQARGPHQYRQVREAYGHLGSSDPETNPDGQLVYAFCRAMAWSRRTGFPYGERHGNRGVS